MIRPGGDHPIEIHDGLDTDHDGRPDTAVLHLRDELAFVVDVDHDNLADLLVRIGADGTAVTSDLDDDPDAWASGDLDVDECYDLDDHDWS